MIKKSLFFPSLLLTCMFLMNSCGAIVKSKARKHATVEKGAIPPDFGEGNSIVLFITTGKKSYDKYLKSNIRKVYHGNHEFIRSWELNSGRYDDTSKFRYIFDYEKTSYSYRSNNTTIHGPGGGIGTGTVRRFSITDRIDDKTYVMPMTSSFWSKLQRMYLKNMEEIRIQNNGGTQLSK